jgi:hypothetical protein
MLVTIQIYLNRIKLNYVHILQNILLALCKLGKMLFSIKFLLNQVPPEEY